MAAQSSLIPVEEYLRTTSDPDCEYVDGVIEERPVGEYDHATWQTILAAFFTIRQDNWVSKRVPNCECRLHIAGSASPT